MTFLKTFCQFDVLYTWSVSKGTHILHAIIKYLSQFLLTVSLPTESTEVLIGFLGKVPWWSSYFWLFWTFLALFSWHNKTIPAFYLLTCGGSQLFLIGFPQEHAISKLVFDFSIYPPVFIFMGQLHWKKKHIFLPKLTSFSFLTYCFLRNLKTLYPIQSSYHATNFKIGVHWLLRILWILSLICSKQGQKIKLIWRFSLIKTLINQKPYSSCSNKFFMVDFFPKIKSYDRSILTTSYQHRFMSNPPKITVLFERRWQKLVVFDKFLPRVSLWIFWCLCSFFLPICELGELPKKLLPKNTKIAIS